ncbi:hypothetical protein [Actinacidiphila yeochonensis]|uniref:hypothetical protein n=1 Tax=Actinacidiphila yeochonensis TaxID=89050 RepID=UPI00055AF59D|nr:hypothetical protein [Actinacidiphila yeochonensis]
MAATKWVRQDLTASGGAGAGSARGSQGVTLLQAPDAPLFAALVRQWQSAGRMVPGQTDHEWAELVGRVPRLTGV